MQIVILHPERSPAVVGIPASLRAAKALSAAGLGSVYLATRDGAFSTAWSRVLDRVPDSSWIHLNGHPGLPDRIEGGQPLLILAADGLAEPGAVRLFEERARRESGRAAWTFGGEVVGLYASKAGDLAAAFGPGAERLPQVSSAEFPADGGWRRLDSPAAVRSAEREVLDGLRGRADGFIARHDRAVSTWISVRLSRLTITPNQITTASLAVSLAGGALLAAAGRPWQAAGALLLWAGAILDGCDGEVARLTFQSSPAGAAYDLIADQFAHAAAFAGIAANVIRFHPETPWRPLAALLAAGIGMGMAVTHRLRGKPKREAGPTVFERLSGRDYVYVILALSIAGRLDWLFWAAAFGSQAFWIAVLLWS